jgi:hypothetical protein
MDRFEEYGHIARTAQENNPEIFDDNVIWIENGLNYITIIFSWIQFAPYFDDSLGKYQGSEDIVHHLLKIELEIHLANFVLNLLLFSC